MLWFLGLCAAGGIVVTAYRDDAEGQMAVGPDGGGRFTGITLRPSVTVRGRPSDAALEDLHREANAKCFIANSLNIPVQHAPTTIFDAAGLD